MKNSGQNLEKMVGRVGIEPNDPRIKRLITLEFLSSWPETTFSRAADSYSFLICATDSGFLATFPLGLQQP